LAFMSTEKQKNDWNHWTCFNLESYVEIYANNFFMVTAEMILVGAVPKTKKSQSG